MIWTWKNSAAGSHRRNRAGEQAEVETIYVAKSDVATVYTEQTPEPPEAYKMPADKKPLVVRGGNSCGKKTIFSLCVRKESPLELLRHPVDCQVLGHPRTPRVNSYGCRDHHRATTRHQRSGEINNVNCIRRKCFYTKEVGIHVTEYANKQKLPSLSIFDGYNILNSKWESWTNVKVEKTQN